MLAEKALTDLAVQKRLLVAESEANRIALGAELRRVLTPLEWLDRMRSKTAPLLLLGAPIAGYLATRKLPGALRWVSRGMRVFRVFKVLGTVLRRRRA